MKQQSCQWRFIRKRAAQTGCSFLFSSIILGVRMDATVDAKFSFLFLSPEIVTKKPLFLSE